MTKNRNRDFFETLYIRKRSIDILSELEVYEPFCFSVQLGKRILSGCSKRSHGLHIKPKRCR